MEFIRSEGTQELETALTLSLNAALAKKESVVWIVTGGSNAAVCAKVMLLLTSDNLNNLTIILSDERYGMPGHADSNFLQLMQAGFNVREATFTDLLSGSTFEDTTETGNEAMEAIFTQAKTVIGLLGMGPDGHIAGILPHSPAAVSDKKWMIGYDGGQFQRITLTPFALSHVQQMFLGTFGSARKPALQQLHDGMLPIAEQPAQILRHIPDTSIFNDQIGD